MSELISKWHMHRLGLVDFWYYVNEEFSFKDGHMLLRGSNGSGKSVTMQSFIPLLLDGNKSSERLDPFGTRSRKIENYLLEEGSERTDRIGYLYLEFKRSDSEVYKTIGMGLHAKQGRPLVSWYFVIEDNLRINRDIHLLDHNLAITKQMLKNRIGDTQVMDSQKEYMDRVNQALFGFETIEEYKEAITLLLQLRSPKLSNSLKPTMINEILSESLQPLSEDDLRPMSEAISNMDNIKDQLDALKQSYTSAKAVYQVFDQYSHAVLFDKLHIYQNVEQTAAELHEDYQKNEKELQQHRQETKQKQANRAQLVQEQELLTEEKLSLATDDLQRLVEDCTRLSAEKEENTQKLHHKENLEEEKSNRLQDLRTQHKTQSERCEESLSEMKDAFAQLDELQQELLLEDHLLLKEELFEHPENAYEFTYIGKRLDAKLHLLEEGLRLFDSYDVAKSHHEQLLEELEQQKQMNEQQEQQVEQLDEQYDRIVEEYKERISQWSANNVLLKLTDKEFHEILHLLMQYEEQPDFYKLTNIIQQNYQTLYKDTVHLQIVQREMAEVCKKDWEQKTAELHMWQTQKDPSPAIEKEQEQARQLLKQHQIESRSFYSLLEFDDQLDDRLRALCEEALLRLGVLDAQIVHKNAQPLIEAFAQGSGDMYFFTQQKVKTLRPYYLKGTTPEQLAEEINTALTSFAITYDGKLQLHDAMFQTGIVQGKLYQSVPARYIGENARQKYREQMIQQLQVACDMLKVEYDQQVQNLTNLDKRLERLEEEKTAFVKEDDLHLALQVLNEGQRTLQYCITCYKQMEERLQKHSETMQGIEKQLRETAGKLSITLRRNVFEQQKGGYNSYRELLQLVQMKQPVFIQSLDIVKSCEIQIEDAFQDVSEFKAEIDALRDQIKKQSLLLQQKEKQLKDLGYEDKQQRIRQIEERLHRLPDLIRDLDTRLGQLDSLLETKTQEQEGIKQEIEYQDAQVSTYFEVVKNEAALGYTSVMLCEDAQLIGLIRNLERQAGLLKKAEALKMDLQTAYYNHRSNLQEYNLTFTTDDTWEELSDISARLDINARYQGTSLSFPELLDCLQRDIDLQNNLLVDSDRHLFEDILVNIISKKVRIRIQNSRMWVDTMNRYMNAMNTSSGLHLNLQWKSKKAESEDEMDTRQLVDILQKDVKVVKESDLKRLSSHFRSKIAAARNLQNIENNTLSFHQLMRQVMDYRKWFEFKIMAQKTGEAKKELTNNAFYAFSGGEKAMAMYVPLFSAVAAKFESAREDVPLLIALDEAFAGVDEKNIYNMFDLISKFKFDYIMNSQVLWGDYASVKGLAIYELFRPENARFVTVIPYEWDGHVKRMKGEQL